MKANRILALFLACAALAWLGNACKEEEPKPFAPIPEKWLNDFGCFGKGSYWIYENKRTNEKDTIYLEYGKSTDRDYGMSQQSKSMRMAYVIESQARGTPYNDSDSYPYVFWIHVRRNLDTLTIPNLVNTDMSVFF